MSAEIDRLEVQVEVSAAKANAELNKLIGKLGKVEAALSGVSSKSLSRFAGRIEKIGQSIQKVNRGGSTQKMAAGFTRLSGGIAKSANSMKSFSQMAGKLNSGFFLMIHGAKQLGKAMEQSADNIGMYPNFGAAMDKIGAKFSDMYAGYGCDSAEEYVRSFAGRMNELTKKITGCSESCDKCSGGRSCCGKYHGRNQRKRYGRFIGRFRGRSRRAGPLRKCAQRRPYGGSMGETFFVASEFLDCNRAVCTAIWRGIDWLF